jgi:4-amino-4-deoxy-L-arabinose transferase-like glycosyltransferase
MSPRAQRLWLLVITALAAVIRLVALDRTPPGLNQDEAIGAWISWCLLKTGRDMSGQPWPIFYAHGIGDFPSTLFFYVTMPFQAVGGLNVWTTRLPAACAGIAAVPVLYFVGARLFGPATGLLAALMLALDPWHVFLSRFGVGASQCPLDALLPVALLLAAGLPLADAPRAAASRAAAPPRIDAVRAALAGIAAGFACYGFHPMRLYFPVLFALLAILLASDWMSVMRTREGRAALLAFAAGLAVTAGPLAWQHLVNPEIGHRWQMTRLWSPGTPLATVIGMILGRWLEHFGPDFLFLRGDHYVVLAPPHQGEFGWHLLPLMVAGLAMLGSQIRASRSARVLLAMLIAYPAGDVISRYDGVHALRSAPGVAALVLLGAWGAVGMVEALRRRGPQLARVATAAILIAVLAFDGRFLWRFFGEWSGDPYIYYNYQADLVEAARWLKPRLDQEDAVFCTVAGLNEPWSILLVETGHDPRAWLAEPRDRREGEYDVYVRYGKMHFMYADLWRPELERLTADGKPERVLFIVRPGELGLQNPEHVVRGPGGHDALWIVERRL